MDVVIPTSAESLWFLFLTFCLPIQSLLRFMQNRLDSFLTFFFEQCGLYLFTFYFINFLKFLVLFSDIIYTFKTIFFFYIGMRTQEDEKLLQPCL